jgi:hypothetical protein
MNRKQWKAQHSGSHINDWWLTWSRDEEYRRKLERRQIIKDVLFAVFFLAVALVIYWGIPT